MRTDLPAGLEQDLLLSRETGTLATGKAQRNRANREKARGFAPWNPTKGNALGTLDFGSAMGGGPVPPGNYFPVRLSAWVRSPIGVWPCDFSASSRCFRPASSGRPNRSVTKRSTESVSYSV